MTATATLEFDVRYVGSAGCASWQGRHVRDAQQFKRYVREVVRPRLTDEDLAIDSYLSGLATTGMATEFVERLLKAVPAPESSEVGEALAECVLQQDPARQVHWPWNTVRDKRTPKASLPGADLVGFCCENDVVLLLFGEVKTSSETRTPPTVMTGSDGLASQLVRNANAPEIHRALLAWLLARCQSEPNRTLFQRAVSRFLNSGGKEVLLVGVLLRDTEPNEFDLKKRGEELSKEVAGPTRIELIAWYLPVPIAEWRELLLEEAS